ncbi:TetR/AcrR family transcriptional regulator [Vagococcus acidifermentans]|nr:TetR/AcrR family transcriptional regulator [Vagococcus acidifermentans]
MPATRKNFSAEDKNNIKKKLQEVCAAFWAEQGYKETSISKLCKGANISTGTFYNLYESKEELFLDALKKVQTDLNEQFIADIKQSPSKQGFIAAIENLYYEYEKNPFLYDNKTVDFLAFYNKLSEADKAKLEEDNSDFFRQAIAHANLTLKESEQMAFAVFSVLLSTVSSKEALSKQFDFKATFQFMVQHLMDEIFE